MSGLMHHLERLSVFLGEGDDPPSGQQRVAHWKITVPRKLGRLEEHPNVPDLVQSPFASKSANLYEITRLHESTIPQAEGNLHERASFIFLRTLFFLRIVRDDAQ